MVGVLEISFEDDDFHWHMDCDTPENDIENQCKKVHNHGPPKTTPKAQTPLLIKLSSPHAQLLTKEGSDAAGDDLYSCEPIIIPSGTQKLLITGIPIATPNNRIYARIAPRPGLSGKALDIGVG